MKILAVDMGTGTQDILLFDTRVDVENSLKMVQPSPTMIAHRKIKEATRREEAILLTGLTMGGGPSHWAAEDHIKAGLPVYATPDAARTFNDDLDFLVESGVTIVGDDEAKLLSEKIVHIKLKDLDLEAISNAFAEFDISLDDLNVIAAAVFDHGAAPPGYSDRQFRFDYLTERIQQDPRLSAFSYLSDEIPEIMTRMQAVANSADESNLQMVLMDTAPAAVLGALQDVSFSGVNRLMVTNVGNFHTIGFRIGSGKVEGVFEHHTGLLDTDKLDRLLSKFSQGNLTHDEIFSDQGHGALITAEDPLDLSQNSFGVAVTGPRWEMMRSSKLHPHFATPHGDMMMAGCYGLVRAAGDRLPEYKDEIMGALIGGREMPPWELD